MSSLPSRPLDVVSAEVSPPLVATAEAEIPAWFLGDLRSDHAGETGAVAIYRGMLATARDPDVRRFAERHLETEAQHLAVMERLLAPEHRSALLPIWRPMGWLTGAIPAALGPRAAFATVQSVETFVDRHYQEQLDKLDGHGAHAELYAALEACQADERHHRDEGAQLAGPERPAWLRLWCWLVGAGSAAAVAAARRI